MIFSVQISNPRVISSNLVVPDLADAIRTVFPADTECVYLTWHHVPIPIAYRDDLSVMIEDIVDMVEAIAGAAGGHFSVRWGSNTCDAKWDVTWTDRTMTIQSEWYSVVGDTEAHLNQRPQMTLGTIDFLGEWRSLLAAIEPMILRSGVRLADRSLLDRLQAFTRHFNVEGCLYSTREDSTGDDQLPR